MDFLFLVSLQLNFRFHRRDKCDLDLFPPLATDVDQGAVTNPSRLMLLYLATAS
jgi:hypothetical protein